MSQINLLSSFLRMADISKYIDDSLCFAYTQDIAAASAGTDNPLLLLRNNAGDGKTIYLYYASGGCAVANVSFTFKVFANPTITTNGTAQTPKQSNLGSVVPSTASLSSLPTVSSSGAALSAAISGQNSNSVNLLDGLHYQIMPGNSVLITGNPLSNNRLASLTLRWIEI